jgi:hypothetical protein
LPRIACSVRFVLQADPFPAWWKSAAALCW